MDTVLQQGQRYRAVFFCALWIEGECFAPKQYVVVLEEGDPAVYFDGEATRNSRNEEFENSNSNTNVDAEAGGEIIDESIFNPTGSWAKGIALMRNQGLEVDDDNKPAPKNIPANSTLEQSSSTTLNPGQIWGWDGIDPHEILVPTKNATFQDDWSPL